MVEIESDMLNKLIECKQYHKHVPEFGERAWLAEGKDMDVIYWDVGNGWCSIMLVVSKNCLQCRKATKLFYSELLKKQMLKTR